MSFNGKHLSLEDRKIIENNINKGLRKFETAKRLNKSQSTIGKEIKNNRKVTNGKLDTLTNETVKINPNLKDNGNLIFDGDTLNMPELNIVQ